MAIPHLKMHITALVILMQLFCCVGGDLKSYSLSGLCDGRQHNDCVSVQSSNCSVEEVTSWFQEGLPTCHNYNSCGSLHLNMFEHYEDNDIGKHFGRNALNVTIQKPISNNLVWIMYEDSKNVNDSKCFTLNISSETKCDNQMPIYYDCHVKNSNGSTIMTPNFVTTIKAVANEKKFLFKFRNLFAKNLSELKKVFFYVSNELGPPIVTFQALEPITQYLIKLCKKNEENCLYESVVDLTNSSTYGERYESLYSMKLGDAALTNGSYEISVSCLNNTGKIDCINPNKYDFEILITYKYTVEIIVIALVIPMIIGIIIGFFVYRKNREILLPIDGLFQMLLVYDGVSDEHVAHVKAFWLFLRETLGVSNVLLDVINIAHDSPFKWYCEKMKQADCVAIIVPGQPGTHRGCRFKDTYQLCLNLLESRWNARANCKDDLVILLPNSDKDLLPSSLRMSHRFIIPSQSMCLKQFIAQVASRPNPSTCSCIRIPEFLFYNRKKMAESYFSYVDNVLSKTVEQGPFLPVEPIQIENDKQQIEEEEEEMRKFIQHREEELDDAFGTVIPSVRELPLVVESP